MCYPAEIAEEGHGMTPASMHDDIRTLRPCGGIQLNPAIFHEADAHDSHPDRGDREYRSLE